jgi:hypothetical protein
VSRQSDLQLIQHIARELDANPVDRLGYTEDAFNNDLIAGVEVFDKNAQQNVPKAADYNPSVKDKGVRSQAGSIPRMSWNHFLGRLSFNLNKVVQKLVGFFAFLAAWMSHNAAEYDNSAHYRHGDVCYVVSESGGIKVYTWYIRTSLYPETITGIGPIVTVHWEEMQSATSSSALLPFAAPGYRHKYAVADLSAAEYDRDTWYPVVTGFQDFSDGFFDGKDDVMQVLIEAYCAGAVAGETNPHRADLAVAASFTGFAESSTDVVLRNVFIDQITGEPKDSGGSPIGYSRLPKGRQAVLWLRGGSVYALWNSFGSVFAPQTGSYDNGLDPAIEPGGRMFAPVYGTLRARLATPDAVLPEEAPNLGQLAGALPLPKELRFGEQLDAVRIPGIYVATGADVANSIGQLPIANPGPFELAVTGDKAGLSTTIQRLIVRATGNEYTRTLAGNVVIVPWYRSASPEGTAIFAPGLYRFEINSAGHLIQHYQNDSVAPDFWIDGTTGHLLTEI